MSDSRTSIEYSRFRDEWRRTRWWSFSAIDLISNVYLHSMTRVDRWELVFLARNAILSLLMFDHCIEADIQQNTLEYRNNWIDWFQWLDIVD